ncbi:MAG TPA: hypothetical protein VF146_14190, partial [Bryobacteraceae bacterium]
MCRTATIRLLASIGVLVAGVGSFAQNLSIDWRHIGNSAIDWGLPSVATGPVSRVWYSTDGSVLYARTATGRIYQTSDFERWEPVTNTR